MKNILKTSIALVAAFYLISCSSHPTGEPTLNNNMDSVSYAIGMYIGIGPANVHDKEDIDIDLVMQGLVNGINEADTNFTQQVTMTILNNFSREQQQKAAEVDKEAGIAYLKENLKKEGVIETESGLQYRILREGTGASPLATDSVKVDYKGTTIDGEEFDSSYKRGQATFFQLNRVIAGWTEGIQLMKEGAKFEFVIPSEIAYGPRGSRGIKPNSTLIFEVELHEVIKTKASE